MDNAGNAHDPSADGPPPETPDDLIDPSQPLDPAQWAIHGLLSVYFERAGQDTSPHVQTILDRVARERQRVAVAAAGEPLATQRREPVGRRTAGALFAHSRVVGRTLAGIAAAAAILTALLLFWSYTGGGRAMALDLREIGFAAPLPLISLWLDPADEEAYRAAEEAVAEARLELKQALIIDDDSEIGEPWIPWTKLYRNLRAMGQWDEALGEMQAFLSYAEERNEQPLGYSPYYVCLTDLGNTYQAVGDFDMALAYHEKSLIVARDFQEEHLRRKHGENLTSLIPTRDLAGTLVPRLGNLGILAAADGDLPKAWEYWHEANELLETFFRLQAEAGKWSLPPDAAICALARAAAATNDHQALSSMIIKVREHQLRKATFFRLARDLEAASEALRLGQSIPDYPYADDSRLDFNEPMEELRIAIARGNFAAALTAADEAEQNTDARHFEDHPNHAPIGLLVRAELRFLRGIALAGQNPQNPKARTLIESALQAVQQSAALLPEGQEKRLLERFADWNGAAEFIRQQQLPDAKQES